jgi:hypothetical protein
MLDRIQYPDGVPRWFAYAWHWWSKRRCLKRGHVITAWPNVCDWCGEERWPTIG